MTGFLLDTNCISEVVRLRPDPNVIRWIDQAEESTLHISVLTMGEIRKGIVKMVEGKRRALLEIWLEVDLKQRFATRILPVDSAVANMWGALAGETALRGFTMPIVDGILAATAMHHKLTIVSRNIADFRKASVAVLNPWEPV